MVAVLSRIECMAWVQSWALAREENVAWEKGEILAIEQVAGGGMEWSEEVQQARQKGGGVAEAELVYLGYDILEQLMTYHVSHPLVHESVRTASEEGHLFPKGHEAAQDGKDFLLSQEEFLHVLLDSLVYETLFRPSQPTSITSW